MKHEAIEAIDNETNGAASLALAATDDPAHFTRTVDDYLDILAEEPFDPKRFLAFVRQHGSPQDARVSLKAMMNTCPALLANYLR